MPDSPAPDPSVSELRHDPLTGRVVVVAPVRALRPETFREALRPPSPAGAADCPFCPGHEAMTPPEVARTGSGAPDTPGWRVRVVPNLYPIVTPEPPGVTGDHEIVILSPAHDRPFRLLDDTEAAEAVGVLRDRAALHLAAGRAHVQALVNHGREAGGSIEHPHAQSIALGFVPPGVTDALARFAAAGRDLVAEALDTLADSPVAVLGGAAPAWCPPASGSPYEVLVAHRRAGARFDEATDTEVADVARSTRDVLARLHAVLADAPYNVTVHTAPRDVRRDAYHWHVRVAPRLTVRAGFEEATGVLVNVVAPEEAARALRAAAP